MKKYIDQIFYEGLGRSIYCPIEKVINKIDNKTIRKVCIVVVKCLYFILAISIAVMLFYIVI